MTRERAITQAIAATRRISRRFGAELLSVEWGTGLSLHLWQLFRQLNIDVVLDVGGRTGEYGLLLRRNGYQGRIISFEPNPAL